MIVSPIGWYFSGKLHKCLGVILSYFHYLNRPLIEDRGESKNKVQKLIHAELPKNVYPFIPNDICAFNIRSHTEVKFLDLENFFQYLYTINVKYTFSVYLPFILLLNFINQISSCLCTAYFFLMRVILFIEQWQLIFAKVARPLINGGSSVCSQSRNHPYPPDLCGYISFTQMYEA